MSRDEVEVVLRFIEEELLDSYWHIYEIERFDGGFIVIAQYALPPNFCANCGTVNPKLVKYGRQQLIRNWSTPFGRIRLHTTRQRYYCKECGHTFWEILPLMIPADQKGIE